MTPDLIIKIIAVVFVTLIGVAKLLKYDPLKIWKEDVIRDLDILSKLDVTHSSYNTVKASADLSLLMMYSKDHRPWYLLSCRKNKIFYILVTIMSASIVILFAI